MDLNGSTSFTAYSSPGMGYEPAEAYHKTGNNIIVPAPLRPLLNEVTAANLKMDVKGGPIPGRCGGVKPGQWRPAA